MMQCIDFEAEHATTILQILDLMGLSIVKNPLSGYRDSTRTGDLRLKPSEGPCNHSRIDQFCKTIPA